MPFKKITGILIAVLLLCAVTVMADDSVPYASVKISSDKEITVIMQNEETGDTVEQTINGEGEIRIPCEEPEQIYYTVTAVRNGVAYGDRTYRVCITAIYDEDAESIVPSVAVFGQDGSTKTGTINFSESQKPVSPSPNPGNNSENGNSRNGNNTGTGTDSPRTGDYSNITVYIIIIIIAGAAVISLILVMNAGRKKKKDNHSESGK